MAGIAASIAKKMQKIASPSGGKKMSDATDESVIDSGGVKSNDKGER